MADYRQEDVAMAHYSLVTPPDPQRRWKDRFLELFPVAPVEPGVPTGLPMPLGSATTILGGLVVVGLLLIPFVLCR